MWIYPAPIFAQWFRNVTRPRITTETRSSRRCTENPSIHREAAKSAKNSRSLRAWVQLEMGVNHAKNAISHIQAKQGLGVRKLA